MEPLNLVEDLSSTPNSYMCDLIKLQLNQSMRPDLMKTFLEDALAKSSSSSKPSLLYSIPRDPVSITRAIILLSTSVQAFISSESILMVNCSEDLQSLCRRVFPRNKLETLSVSEEKDPYYSLALCQEMIKTDQQASVLWAQRVNVQKCKNDLKEFIYEATHEEQQELREKIEVLQAKFEAGEVAFREERKRESWELDSESTYEESFNQHGYQKTWDFQNRELYKVTEYNESLECSVSDEGSDLASKLNEFSMKATNSIADRFPKFSFASLSLSETSYQNIYESFKKSLNFNEALDILPSTPEKFEEEFPKLQESFPVSSTQICTLSDSNTFKSSLENRSENCNCTSCLIF